ncbi:LysR family transcriptional regulator [Nocardia brasiliensis]
MGITQPAVSLRLRQLENRLGVTLLERVGRQVRPTAAGAELLMHAARIEDAVAVAVDSLAAGQDHSRRTRVSAAGAVRSRR